MKKIYAYINVILYLLLGADGYGRVTSWFLYPILHWIAPLIFWCRTKPILKYIVIPLWLYYGEPDKIDIGNEQECWNAVKKLTGIKNINPINNKWHRFLCAYYWQSIRNPCWNFYELFMVNDYRTDIDVIKAERYYYNKQGELTTTLYGSNPLLMKRAKFYFKDNPEKTSNRGDYVSWDKSIFGKSKVYFKVKGFWLVAYSSCWIKKVTKDRFVIRELNFGMLGRILFRNKYQRKLKK